ncbi:MAG: DNA N-6-adenine-methyltransferase [Phycisphaerae bacterium]
MTAGRNIISMSQTWCTPPKYVRAVRDVFGGTIALDPCSNNHSIVHADVEYQLPRHDGLHSSWDYPTIYVNPPYGADRHRGTTIKDWLRRCAMAHNDHASEVLALVPVATNTKHWKLFVFGVASAIAFLYDTRLRFLVDGKDEGKGAPMACAMIYWGKNISRFSEVFTPHGAVLDMSTLKGKRFGTVMEDKTMFLFADSASNG